MNSSTGYRPGQPPTAPPIQYAPPLYGQPPMAPPPIQYASPLYGQPPMAPPPIRYASPLYGQPPTAPPPIQYASGVPPKAMIHNGDWSTRLCHCDDVSTCCIAFWCPCIIFGKIAEIVDKGTPSSAVHMALYMMILSLTGCQCVYGGMYRSKLRHQYTLNEEPCNDFIVHYCCQAWALRQEYRELQRRGFNMSFGWHGNMERQNQGVVMPQFAPVQMKR